MNHLTESQLNEYLDNAMGSIEQASTEEHLSGCDFCRTRMEELRSLFETLSLLPEEEPDPGLAAQVLQHLRERKNRPAWRLVLAIQAGIALGLTILIVTNLHSLIYLINIYSAFPLKFALIQLPSVHFHLPTISIQISTANLTFLAISALILWGVGNTTLLRGRKVGRK